MTRALMGETSLSDGCAFFESLAKDTVVERVTDCVAVTKPRPCHRHRFRTYRL